MNYKPETRIAMLEHRIALLKARNEVGNMHLIAKATRQIRKYEKLL